MVTQLLILKKKLSKKRDATLRVLNRILHSLFRSIAVCFFGCGVFSAFFWNSSDQAFADRTSRGLRSCCAAASASDQNHTANIVSNIPARVPIIYLQKVSLYSICTAHCCNCEARRVRSAAGSADKNIITFLDTSSKETVYNSKSKRLTPPPNSNIRTSSWMCLPDGVVTLGIVSANAHLFRCSRARVEFT